MIAAAGLLMILISLGAAATLAVRGINGARTGEVDATRLMQPALILLAAAVAAFFLLELAIVAHDYSIKYVANTTSNATPFIFLLASGWAALEGSIVLWGLLLAVFTWLVVRRVKAGDRMGAGAAGIMGVVAVFWFGLMATFANPFEVCTRAAQVGCASSSWFPFAEALAPLDGRGPNPLLQNHILMAVHPPLLYVGYVGFTVPFAYAMSALWLRQTGSRWLDVTHRWTLISWTFLTTGILLGAWWSYEVLGWGGYWAWDPVENAAFLPWLVATAFIHSAVVQRKRGMLQAWNIVLVISTFALTILGTFLTRSGVIFSVHSFTQSAVGPVLLVFLGLVVVGGFGLFAVRADVVGSAPRLDSLASREGVFLANNLLLTLFAFTVLLGTMLPLLVEGFTGNQVTVGRPFFDKAAIPLSFALLLAMGIGPVTPYRSARGDLMWERLRSGIVAGLAAGVAAIAFDVRSIPVVIVVVLAGFVISTILRHYFMRVAAVNRPGDNWIKSAGRVLAKEPGYWGGQISHLGLALVAVAIATSSALAVRQSVELEVGGSAVVDDYCVTYQGPFSRAEPNRIVEGAEVLLLRSDCATTIRSMEPRVHRYPNSTQAVATPDVRTGLVDDVYLSLSGLTERGTLILEVFVFPLMWVLWFGGLVTAAGGVFALRARRRSSQRADDVVTAA
ncbi:MAG: heme lyase CcmF/NrfE family subunit [bacterium]|nr:heme lyase CcmF/NrfE family subunit [bacterium]